MKSCSPALAAYLTSGQQFLLADLYTFTLPGGAVYRYAAADGDIVYGGNTYDASSIVMERGQIRTVIGVDFDTLDITIHAAPTHTIAGAQWIQAARQGIFDGARLRVEQLVMPSFGDTSLGTVIKFTGRVGPLNTGRDSVKMTILSDLELLNIDMPRNRFQPGCINTLFDSSCGLTAASFEVASSALINSSRSVIYCGLSSPSGYFSRGRIKWTSGALSGLSAGVSSYVPGQLTLYGPLPSAPAVGDTFNAYPGCDKTQATCSAKFSNLTKFRGFPYVPAPESVI